MKKGEITASQLLRILSRRKIFILWSVAIVFLLVFIYNLVIPSKYEATVVLKKEGTDKSEYSGEFEEIMGVRSRDEVETEMEIVKTRNVLDQVISELGLPLEVIKIVNSVGRTMMIEKHLVDYSHQSPASSSLEEKMPVFSNTQFFPEESGYEFYIEKDAENSYTVYKADGEKLGKFAKAGDDVHIIIPGISFDLDWSGASINSAVHCKVDNYFETLRGLEDAVVVSQKLKTGIFEISVRSESPIASQLIANTVAEKFREARLSQKQQTIHYSFNFVDNQLQDISAKLRKAENDLSEFKSTHKITTIDENSKDIVEFLSSLETEKVKTDLELSEYENKVAAMKEEHRKEGFFDQTYLTPERADDSYSPFSTLLRQLSDLELKRLELLQRRTESHPEVIAVDDQIKQITEKLSTYNKNTLKAFQIIINSLKSKRSNLNSLIEKYSSKIENIPVQETKLADLIRQKNVYEKIFNLLLNKREEMRIAELSKLQDIVVIDPAHKPIRPVTPRKALNLAVGLILGLIGGLIAVMVAEYRNPRLAYLEDVENEYSIPILSIIPKYSREIAEKIDNKKGLKNKFVALMPDQHGIKESFRVLNTKILNIFESLQDDHSPDLETKKILMITSCEENTGKTSVTTNFGIALAESGHSVLIIDCDLKKPKIADFFEIPGDKPGLIRFLSENIPYPDTYQPFAEKKNFKAVKNLTVIPAGGITDNSSTLLQSTKMRSLLEMIKDFEYILLDTPPITRVVDVLSLGRIVKDLVLVIRPDHTFKDSIQWAVDELEQSKLRIFGFVVNACDVQKSSYRYKYGYGYGYSYGTSGKSSVRK
ncbi:MAG: polysaccharide biosynthesis tyrosine autokinase [Calditrichia bacterium]